MSSDPAGARPGPQAGQQGEPSEAELRATYEAELSRITSADMILQAAVSLLNIGSYRLAPPGAAASAPPGSAGQDLEQARDAIDAVRALLEILERRQPTELAPLRDALSQLQLAYAREAQAGAGEERQSPGEDPGGGEQPGAGAQAEQPAGADQQGGPRPGPAESSGRLWVPGR